MLKAVLRKTRLAVEEQKILCFLLAVSSINQECPFGSVLQWVVIAWPPVKAHQ